MQFGVGFLLALAISSGAVAARALTAKGGLVAVILGTLIYGLGGWEAAIILLAFFLSTSLMERALKPLVASPTGAYAKTGQRDAGQVVANGLIAALFVAAGHRLPDAIWPWVGFAASVAAVTADTWATELGAISRSAPRLITRLSRRVHPGTSGGITPIGTAAAAAGGLLIGALATVLGPTPESSHFLPIAAGGFLGALFDSALGATLQGMYMCPAEQVETEQHPLHHCGEPTVHIRGWNWLNNDVVNLASACFGAFSALVLSSSF